LKESTYTVVPRRRPWHRRLVEASGDRLAGWGLKVARFDEESVFRAARRHTGLEDFGSEEYLTPLRILLEDCARDENIGFYGRMAMKALVVEGLINRLRIQRSLERHPEIRDVEIRSPLFVVGLPRTGTTLLHNLLAQDPAGRAPLLWELGSPWPRENAPPGPDRRIRLAQRRIDMLYRFSPSSAAVHEFHAEEPEECHHLFRNSMATQSFRALADVPEFSRWKLGHDMLAEYRYYRLQLQMLLWQRPATHLVLKFPGHAWHLDALLEIFPDACVVLTHRDPVKVVGSFCSMVTMVRQSVSKRIDTVALGQVLSQELETGIRRMMESRERLGGTNFFDVRYDDLMRDHVAMVREIYRHFGMPLTDEMQQGMQRWIDEHRQHRHGKHVYRLSDYGLTEAGIGERFGEYWERYGRPAGTPV
jgi:hypothetical protein